MSLARLNLPPVGTVGHPYATVMPAARSAANAAQMELAALVFVPEQGGALNLLSLSGNQ